MREMILIAQRQGQGYSIQSPAVGYVSQLPMPGQIITSDMAGGFLTTLSTTYQLRLPTPLTGQVTSYNTELRIAPVAYLTTLFSIVPIPHFSNSVAEQLLLSNTTNAITPDLSALIPTSTTELTSENATTLPLTSSVNNKDAPQKKIIITAPTDGIFYRRPAPDSAPYVEVGQMITKGQILGLVEVMKCFNQILSDLPDFPSQAQLLEICVNDGSEVKYHQPLFIFG